MENIFGMSSKTIMEVVHFVMLSHDQQLSINMKELIIGIVIIKGHLIIYKT